MKTKDPQKAVEHLQNNGQVFWSGNPVNSITKLGHGLYWIKLFNYMSGFYHKDGDFMLK